eukprot:scaffold2753_cov115-Isochrysis_galbana.AAC.9
MSSRTVVGCPTGALARAEATCCAMSRIEMTARTPVPSTIGRWRKEPACIALTHWSRVNEGGAVIRLDLGVIRSVTCRREVRRRVRS